MFLSAALTTLIFVTPKVLAHGGVIGYNLDGTYYNGFTAYNSPVGQVSIQREWDSYDPITEPTDPNLSCNVNGASLGSGQQSATVSAGATVTAYWNPWPHTIGPAMVYMASCGGSCTSADTSTLEWFKIEEAGLISGDLVDGTWAMGKLVQNNNSWTTTLPSTLPDGECMLRHELLAIHTSNLPQFYPECAQLVLTGGGSSTPSRDYLVRFPGAYAMSDPGVGIDIYAHQSETNYTIPGPAVWSG
ncbi:glycoside hydrolase family 61 protein B [Amylostereum chailletii]|nr:glycoside hydrolase family 61 protein B [Amylostereum chailletii]